jgi:hypothetical protein
VKSVIFKAVLYPMSLVGIGSWSVSKQTEIMRNGCMTEEKKGGQDI